MVWSINNTETQCPVREKRNEKGIGELLCLHFYCLAIKHSFHFIKQSVPSAPSAFSSYLSVPITLRSAEVAAISNYSQDGN